MYFFAQDEDAHCILWCQKMWVSWEITKMKITWISAISWSRSFVQILTMLRYPHKLLFRFGRFNKCCSPLDNEISEGLFRVWDYDSTNGSLSIISGKPRCSMHFLTISSRWYSWVSAVPEIQWIDFPYFSRKSSEVWGKWNCRFDIQLLGEDQNRQKFLWW